MTTDWSKVQAIAEMPVIIEYISEYDSKSYRCVCNADIELDSNFCPKCGVRLTWQKKEIDPRTQKVCCFCGLDNIVRPIMAIRGYNCICAECVESIYWKLYEGHNSRFLRATENVDMRPADVDED